MNLENLIEELGREGLEKKSAAELRRMYVELSGTDPFPKSAKKDVILSSLIRLVRAGNRGAAFNRML